MPAILRRSLAPRERWFYVKPKDDGGFAPFDFILGDVGDVDEVLEHYKTLSGRTFTRSEVAGKNLILHLAEDAESFFTRTTAHKELLSFKNPMRE